MKKALDKLIFRQPGKINTGYLILLIMLLNINI